MKTENKTAVSLDTETLLVWLANATKTEYACGGHHKSAMNERRATEYREELISRNIEIPSLDELLKTGIFNGDGSY